MAAVKMPFGRYKHMPIDDLPTEYLDWLRTLDLREPLRSSVARIFQQRESPRPELLERLVTAGARVLANDDHIDHGDLTHAVEWLRRVWLRGRQ